MFKPSHLAAPFPSITCLLHAAEKPYSPGWAGIVPKQIIKHQTVDGESLVKSIASLQPGDQFVIAAGSHSVKRMWDILVSGTADAPIWIVAEEGAKVVFTRPDAKQNVLGIRQNHDATPAASAPMARADARYLVETDFSGRPRTQPIGGARTRSTLSVPSGSRLLPISARPR